MVSAVFDFTINVEVKFNARGAIEELNSQLLKSDVHYMV